MDLFAAFGGLIKETLQPPWNYIIAIVAFLVLLLARIPSLQTAWVDIRRGKRELELERMRLENLKLYYEIEALRHERGLGVKEPSETVKGMPIYSKETEKVLEDINKKNDISERKEKVKEDVKSAADESIEKEEPKISICTQWALRHPLVALPASYTLLVVLAILTLMFGGVALVTPLGLIAGSAEQDMQTSFGVMIFSAIFVVLVFSVFTYYCYKWMKSVKNWQQTYL